MVADEPFCQIPHSMVIRLEALTIKPVPLFNKTWYQLFCTIFFSFLAIMFFLIRIISETLLSFELGMAAVRILKFIKIKSAFSRVYLNLTISGL